jgi:hypothetical protein
VFLKKNWLEKSKYSMKKCDKKKIGISSSFFSETDSIFFLQNFLEFIGPNVITNLINSDGWMNINDNQNGLPIFLKRKKLASKIAIFWEKKSVCEASKKQKRRQKNWNIFINPFAVSVQKQIHIHFIKKLHNSCHSVSGQFLRDEILWIRKE